MSSLIVKIWRYYSLLIVITLFCMLIVWKPMLLCQNEDHGEIDVWPDKYPIYLNISRVLYNRVPKCGSTTTLQLFKTLGRKNGWSLHGEKFFKLPNFPGLTKVPHWRAENVTQIAMALEHILRGKTPYVFECHFHFTDFSRYVLLDEQPVYINLIRDPLDRLISWYYFTRFVIKEKRMSAKRRQMTYSQCVEGDKAECTAANPEGYFTLVPFFCGHDPICLYPNPSALSRAKQNVERYAVIGVLEMYEDFLLVLENTIPQYFSGAQNAYKKQVANHKGHLRLHIQGEANITDKALSKMKGLLQMEYDFYNFVKQKFVQQRDMILMDLANNKEDAK